MKSLLYGCEDDQAHLQTWTGGKKRLSSCGGVHHARNEESRFAGLVAGSTEVPFATTDQDPKRVFSRAYVKKDRKLHVHEKVKIENIPTSMARGF